MFVSRVAHARLAPRCQMRAFRVSQSHSVSKRRVDFVSRSGGSGWSLSVGAVDDDSTAASPGDAAAAALVQSRRTWVPRLIAQHFLPKHYPHSVTPNYIQYVSWQAAQMVVSSASGVLSMQSLLYAIGVGAGSIPMAAALNWILKDGIGQLGAILFGSWAGHRFDADPKRFRMLGCAAQDAANVLEAVTPLVPHLFLPLASLANASM